MTAPGPLRQAIEHIAWTADVVHQAHHQDLGGEWRECPRDTCASSARKLADLRAALAEEVRPIQDLAHSSIEQHITATKLRGSMSELRGVTHPEGWSFRVLIGIGSPGNERLVEMLEALGSYLVQRGVPVARVGR